MSEEAIKTYTEEELNGMSDEKLEELVNQIKDSIDPEDSYEETEVDLDSAEEEVVETNDVEPVSEDSAETVDDEDDSDENVADTETTEEADSDEEPDKDDIVSESEGEEVSESAEKEGEETSKEKTEEVAEPVAEKIKVTSNGKTYEFTAEEMVDQFPALFSKAMGAMQKEKDIAPKRKMLDAIQSEKITEEDLNLFIDAKKGNKDAIRAILKNNEIDPLDLDLEEENSYVPNDYGRDAKELHIQDVVDSIGRDLEYPKTKHVISNIWDDVSWQSIQENPNIISELHKDVVSGVYDTVQPMADKIKLQDGGRRSDLDYYMLAGQQYYQDLRQQQFYRQQQKAADDAAAAEEARNAEIEKARAEAQKRANAKKASAKRSSATLPKGTSKVDNQTNFSNPSDEEYEEWYKSVMDR